MKFKDETFFSQGIAAGCQGFSARIPDHGKSPAKGGVGTNAKDFPCEGFNLMPRLVES